MEETKNSPPPTFFWKSKFFFYTAKFSHFLVRKKIQIEKKNVFWGNKSHQEIKTLTIQRNLILQILIFCFLFKVD